MFDGFESVIKGDSQGDPEESTAAQDFSLSHLRGALSGSDQRGLPLIFGPRGFLTRSWTMTRWQSTHKRCWPLGALLTRADPQKGQIIDFITRWRIDGQLQQEYGERYLTRV